MGVRKRMKGIQNMMSGVATPDLTSEKLKTKRIALLETVRTELGPVADVPCIVVAGAQSSGKSSLIEAITGICLPSGKSITTRMPLVINLHSAQKPGAWLNEVEIPIKKTAACISEATEKLAGDSVICKTPLRLRVCGPALPCLTLVDLPGITHMGGDGIHDLTSSLVNEYISMQNAVILCVVPGVDDLANTEAIKMAKELDPLGQRTIGVLTKLDLCGEHSGIHERLMNRGGVTLELGFFGVRNRKPGADEEACNIESEEQFFRKNSHLVGVPAERLGTTHLVSFMSSLMDRMIDSYMPKVRETLSLYIKTILHAVGNDATMDDKGKMRWAVSQVYSFIQQYREAKPFKAMRKDANVFFRNFAGSLPDYTQLSSEIETAMQDNEEVFLDDFPSEAAFAELYSAYNTPLYSQYVHGFISTCYATVDTIVRTMKLSHVLHKEVMQVVSEQRGLLMQQCDAMIAAHSLVFTKRSCTGTTSMAELLNSYSLLCCERIVDATVMHTYVHLVRNVETIAASKIDVNRLIDSLDTAEISRDLDRLKRLRSLQSNLDDISRL